MTKDRRRHAREPIDDRADEVPGDRRQHRREPADAHFRYLHDTRDPRTQQSGDTPTAPVTGRALGGKPCGMTDKR